jgi:hypothetical protein
VPSESGGGDLRGEVEAVMRKHWRDGYTVPNARVYPFQWLWDSCFHALIWAELGDADRAVAELRSALADQSSDGFVPHVRYVREPDLHADFWGRSGTSSITQPPMFGHAIAELWRRGIEVPDDLVERAHRGLRFLLDDRARTDDGLITVVHPWETGCDDSPRWDDLCGPDGWSAERWYEIKGSLLHTIERSIDGSPLANPAMGIAPASFNALVAFNAAELGLHDDARSLVEALGGRWDGDLKTWIDGPHPSGRVRTVDALLPALVCPAHRAEALAEVIDDAAFGGAFGPPAVHRAEPMFDPATYWRGPAWPQLTYLLWRAGAGVADRLIAGAAASGLAEYWHPDTGEGLGAVPQSWAGLAILATNP